ncbi:related to quinate transport protein [Phialocephala subalpina]|uniref:Related to quinate transport protein n=1 Tax=Phialocephala subalpina TaxID=576137 RepID=A0A1L7XHU7_9HELO|nr:related to quinate transport protein [Phialocephala subalpina]
MGAPLYISEISPPDLRGSQLTLEQLSIVVGAIIAYWITYGTWAIPELLGFVFFFPYSPRWIAMRGREEESLQSLVRLRCLPEDDKRALREWRGILAEVKFQNETIARDFPNPSGIGLELRGWADLFSKKYIPTYHCRCRNLFFQQFSGINAFVYYAPIFFAALGQGYEMSLILSGMVNICQLVAVLPSHPGPALLGVALVYLYVLTYGVSYGPLAWIIPAEIFPNSRRAKGVGVATATIWLSNFVIGVAVPPMLISIGYGTFIFFMCFCLLAAVFSYFFVLEMLGKTLEEMDQVFKYNLGQEEMNIMRQVMYE